MPTPCTAWMGDCLQTGKLFWQVNQLGMYLGQFSFLSIWGRQNKYQPVFLGSKWGTLTSVRSLRWQVTQWQLMLRSSEMGFPWRALHNL